MAKLAMAPAQTSTRTVRLGRTSTVKCSALFKTKTVEKAETTEKKPQRKQSVVDALDFAIPTKKDQELIWEAKDNWKKGESKLSREQYAALSRKIRGSYKDYFKDYVVEERVENTYYKPTDSTGTVPYLPLLVGVVVAMLATTAFVVSQTS